ncbi:MAG TPA: hypothetical protein DCS93_02510 [Microscillaceae bacterium]|nr:hypothetical protein [Microscillaceae bacterium]
MFKNYFIIALRSFRRNRLYASLNILGLAVGIACFMLLYIYVSHETSYDQFHAKSDRLYRTVLHLKIYDREMSQVATSAVLAPTLKKEYPEVERVTRFMSRQGLLSNQNRKFVVDDLVFVDADFLDMFDFEFIQGNPQKALLNPKSIVLTETYAKKLFRTTKNILNKTVEDKEGRKLAVTGVVKDVPTNSSVKFNGLISFNTQATNSTMFKAWNSNFLNTYVLLKKNTDYQLFNKKLYSLKDKLTKEGVFDNKFSKLAALQPLNEVYLKGYEGANEGAQKFVFIFMAVAGFILLIACINYMNMATSGAMNRAKEVGIRKVVGSHRNQLIKQFMLESLLLVSIATLLALTLVELSLPYLSAFSGKQLVFAWFNASNILLIIALIFVVGFLSGLYPAFFISAFNTILVLKGKFIRNSKTARLRKGLVVFQFTLSAIIIISTWVSFQQFDYMMNKSLGYDNTKVYVVPFYGADNTSNKLQVFKNKLRQNPNVKAIASTSAIPGEQNWNSNAYRYVHQGEENSIVADVFLTDTDYSRFMGFKLLKGEQLSPNMRSDSSMQLLVNEEFVKKAGWNLRSNDPKDNPIGQKLEKGRMTIVGVFKDVHVRSLHYKIKPMMLVYRPKVALRYVQVRLQTNDLSKSVASLQTAFSDVEKRFPFAGFFMDQKFAKEYVEDQKRVKLFTIFSGLTVLVACLGLFGLASFTIAQRTKEIGIRKVLGASMQQILQIVTRDFVVLVVIANLIAIPVVLYFTNVWLDRFAYAASINYLVIFFMSGLAAVGIAMLTISWHVLQAARVNPVEVLKDE